MHEIKILSLLLLIALQASTQQLQDAPTEPMRVCRPGSIGPCSTEPFPLSVVSPTFSEDAKRLLDTGSILIVNFVIGKDGGTRDIKVAKSVGGGADEAAVLAISHCKFEPGTYLGKPVAVQGSFSFGPQPMPVASAEQLRSLWTEATQALLRHDYYTASTLARRAIILAPLAKGWRVLLGSSLVGLDQLADAQTVFEAEIKLDPSSQIAYRALGQLYMRQHRLDDAAAQFKKAIEINSQDHDAYAMLGSALFSQRKFSDCVPILDKALAISPNNAKTLLMKGMAQVYLGQTTQGVAELEKAVNSAPDANALYRAAYVLAENDVELDRAMSWAQTSMTIESARLENISIVNLSPAQFALVSDIAKCWHTLGWIDFRRGEFEQARVFIEAAWYLRPRPVIGNHLGQIYEKLHRANDASRVYAMAIAADELPTHEFAPPDEVAEITERLNRLLGKSDSDHSQQGKADLDAMRTLYVPNQAHWEGSKELELTLESKTIAQSREISTTAGSPDFGRVLSGLPLPVNLPIEGQLQVPRRGTLTCTAHDNECRLRFLWDEEASALAIKETAVNNITMPLTDLP